MNRSYKRRWVVRGILALTLVASAGLIVDGEQSGTDATLNLQNQSQLPPSERAQLAAPRDGVTIFTAYKKPLVGLAPNGTLRYYDNRHESYWDVDPVPDTKHTVLYSATDSMKSNRCPVETPCTRNVVERLNFSTGEREILYDRYRPGLKNNEWHDVDRVNDTEIVVAGLVRDRMTIVNTSTGLVEWQWEAQLEFNITSGGSGAFSTAYPEDWTHLNDVEYVNGTIIGSLRNQDAVVFVDRQKGMAEAKTLRSDENHDVLYEQHNPDYIPASEGGPALLIADSQNNRIVEYEWRNGQWEQTWVWGDSQMQWPRDADRLPNGNTLIADTNTNRIVEIDQDANIAWSLKLPQGYKVYDAERLGTGDESANAPAASQANLKSLAASNNEAFTGGSNPSLTLWVTIKQYLPSKLLNGLLFVKPTWLGFSDFPFLLFGGIVALLWTVTEYWWASFSVTIQPPLVLESD